MKSGHKKTGVRHKQKSMPKPVKIKRVRRDHKQVSTKEKILGGLGLGSTLLGGMGAINSKPPQTQFVRTAETESNSSTSKIKQALGNIFGVPTAKADQQTAYLPGAQGSQSLTYDVNSNPDGSTTLTVGGSSVSYSSQQDMLNQLSQLNANSGSLTPEQQQLQAALTNQYYGQYYNNSGSVAAALDPNSPGNIYNTQNNIPINNNVDPNQSAGAKFVNDASGNAVALVNNVGGTIYVTPLTSSGAFGASQSFTNNTDANAYLQKLGVGGTYNSSTGNVTTVVTPPAAPQTVQVTGVVSIYDQNHNIVALQGDYNGQRYAVAGNTLYDQSGQPVTGLSQDIINKIIAAINAANPQFAIITDANGNPISVWDSNGNNITGSASANSVVTAYNQGTQLTLGAPTVTPTSNQITPSAVLAAISNNDSAYLKGLLNSSAIDVNATLAGNPDVRQALYNYMMANGLTAGYSNGMLGKIILDSAVNTSTGQITPGQGIQQTWSNEGLTQAYNSSIHPYTLNITTQPNGQKLYSVSVNLGGVNKITSSSMTAQQVNQFLTDAWKTSDAFLALNANDRAIFAAFVQAGLTVPEFLGTSNLPAPNTQTTETVTYIDGSGQLKTITQPWGTGMLLSEANAKLLQSMFPGSTLTVAPLPNSASYTVNVNGETRQRYELNIPGQAGLSAGLLWQMFTQYGASGINGINNVPGFSASAASAVLPSGTAVSGPVSYVSGNPPAAGTQTASQAPVITTQTLPAASRGAAYSQQLSANGQNLTWSLASGLLPSGVNLSQSGLLSGTPAGIGDFSFSVRVSNSLGQSSTKNFVLSVKSTVTTTTSGQTVLQAWASQTSVSVKAGQSVNVNVHAANGDSVLVGSGKLTAISSNSNVATAAVSSDSNSINITGINAGSTTITLHPSGRTDTGGDVKISVTVTSGSTTTGGGIISTGGGVDATLTGPVTNTNIPPASGGGSTNAGFVTSTIFTGSTAAGGGTGGGGTGVSSSTGGTSATGILVINTNSLATGQVGQAYSQQLSAYCPTLFSWAVVNSQLPAGLKLNPQTGLLSGTPTQSGVFYITVRAAAGDGSAQADKQFVLIINEQDGSMPSTGSIPSVTDVGNDEGVIETADTTTAGQIPSVTNVGTDTSTGANDSEFEGTDEAGGVTVSSVTNVGTNTASNGANDSEFEGTDEPALTTLTDSGSGGSSATGSGQTAPGGSSSGSNINVYDLSSGASGGSFGGSTSANYPGGQQTGSYQGLQTQSAGQAASQNSVRTYTVKKGDTLWGISKKFYGDGRLWRNILEANLDKVQNPRTMRVGITLVIPDIGASANVQTFDANSGQSGSYTIKSGDTLWDLSQKFYNDPLKWTVLRDANAGKFVDQYHVMPGTVLTVPSLSGGGSFNQAAPAENNITTFEQPGSAQPVQIQPSAAQTGTSSTVTPAANISSSQGDLGTVPPANSPATTIMPSVTDVSGDGEFEGTDQ